MSDKADNLFDVDEEFDPLEFDDEVIDQEWMDDDNPYDTIDYPTVRNIEETAIGRAGDRTKFTKSHLGSTHLALHKLLDYNPHRRLVFLRLMAMCEGGMVSSEVTERVNELQKHNVSVFSPMTLCHMLERCGVLELVMPDPTEEHECVEDGVSYLVINEDIDPKWFLTEEGKAELEVLTQGNECREIIFNKDSIYAEVYLAVMELLRDTPSKMDDVNNLAETFEITHHPKKFGNHFVDLLEKTCACEWKDKHWILTELGEKLLPEVEEFCKLRAEGKSTDDFWTGAEA